MDAARIESAADAGLLEVVRAAASAVSGPSHDPVGRLEITPVVESPGKGHLAQLHIEAVVSAHGVGWTVEQLDVRARWEQDAPLAAATLLELLQRFGTSDFVSLTVSDGSTELMDFTLSFTSKLPFVAANQLVAPPQLTIEQAALCTRILQCLGVRARADRGALDVRSHQLRARPRFAAVVDAFELAASSALSVVLYTSTIPATQAVRIAVGPGATERRSLDICISLGFGGGQLQSKRAKEVEELFHRALGLGFAGQGWQVNNSHAPVDNFRSRSVVPPRPRSSWSLNWGQRKS
jgi:hypothetical protein